MTYRLVIVEPAEIDVDKIYAFPPPPPFPPPLENSGPAENRRTHVRRSPFGMQLRDDASTFFRPHTSRRPGSRL